MSRPPSAWRALGWALAALAAVAAAPPLAAELLPLTAWRRADGLAHDHVTDVLLDSHGFLWFCTAAGLSRFDGTGLVGYGAAEGLPRAPLRDLLEVGGGHYLVATDAGLYRFDATGASPTPFTPVAARGLAATRIFVLLRDRAGGVWVGAENGLWRLPGEAGEAARVPLGAAGEKSRVRALLETADGALWVGGEGAVWRLAGGATERVPLPAGAGEVRALHQERDGGDVWVGFDDGVGRFVAVPAGRTFERFGPADGFGGQRVRSLFQGTDGVFWVGAVGGLYRWEGERFRRFTLAHGLPDETVEAMAEDRAGNLWLATDLGGAARLARDGLTTFTRADGLAHESVREITGDGAGRVLVVGEVGAHLAVGDGGSFTALRPGLPPHVVEVANRSTTHLTRDRDGGWWVATALGLWRFPAVRRLEELATTPPLAVLDHRHGLPDDRVWWSFEDRAGDLWVATGGPRPALVRRRHADGGLDVFSPATGLAVHGEPTAIAETADGELWVGWGGGELVRRAGDRLVPLAERPGAEITALAPRSGGGLWVATAADGVWRIDGTGAAARLRRPAFGDAPELLSARALVEDRWRRLYVGTVDGIVRVDPATGARRRFSTGDGLASLETTSAYRDRRGDLWFGTYGGVSRLTPRRERGWPAPEVSISALTVDGVPVPVSPLGDRAPPPVALGPGTHQIEIRYFGLAFDPGRPVRYQHRLGEERLIGSDGPWSAATTQREVRYTQVGAGRYRFEVRAMLADGRTGSRPAGIAITVPPPLWRRPSSLLALAALLTLLLAAAHRLRVARLLALAEVRTRIATDLHDELGAQLARISILTEVVRNRVAESESRQRLGEVGGMARQLSARARDIVWSIDPRLDDLDSLAVRVRETAADLLEGSGARWRLVGPEPHAGGLPLRPELRRNLLLVFQEALHNVARHAGARLVELELRRDGRYLVGRVRDDGAGFDPAQRAAGRGVANLRSRIAAVGGSLVVDAAPGHGTDLRFRVPLAAPSPIKMRWPGRHRRGTTG